MTTRAILAADIKDWIAREDIDPNIGTIIRIAESSIDRNVRIRSMVRSSVLNVRSRSTPLPDDFLEIVSFSLPGQRQLTYRTSKQLRSSGSRYEYSIEGFDVVLNGDPPEPIEYDLVYYARFARLVNDGDTNELLKNSFDLYLYYGLASAAELIQDSAQVDRFMGLAQNVVRELHASDIRAGAAQSLPSRSSSAPRTRI